MMQLEELVPSRAERMKLRSILDYLQTATVAPNMMELAAITRMKDWEVKRAIAFWKKAGLVREVAGEIFHVNWLN